MFNIWSAKVVCAAGGSGWPLIYEYTPDNSDILGTKGQLKTIILSGARLDGIDDLSLARSLLSELHDEYYSGKYVHAYAALKSAAGYIVENYKNKLSGLEFVLSSVVGNVIYVCSFGGGKAVLLRGGKIAKILDSDTDRVVSASGYLKREDILIFSSKHFFDSVGTGVVRTILESVPFELASGKLTDDLKNRKRDGCFDALLLKVDDNNRDDFVVNIPEENKAVLLPDTSKKNFGMVISGLIKKFQSVLPRRQIYIKQQLVEDVSPQSKKTTFAIALILLILLSISIGFGIYKKRKDDAKSMYLGILTQVRNEIDQAIGLASVDPERSRMIFAESQQKLKEIENLNIKDEEFENLKKKIEESRGAILGEYLIKPEMFLDLTLLSSGFSGDKVVLSNGQIYILDVKGKRVLSVNISNKKSKVVAGPSVLANAISISAYDDLVYILQEDGIYSAETSPKKVVNKTWGGGALFSLFAGNIYVLDTEAGQIYRYAGINGVFGERQNWLSGEVGTDFRDAKQISIDGSVYVLFPNAKVLKFSQGNPQNFKISGTLPEIGSIDAMTASPDNQYLYFLDRLGKRIVVTDNRGKYKSQYVDDLIGEATQIAVSEADSRIIILTGSKLYSINTNK